ncbi:hypothetical protein MANI_025981 [Metarhizium anisopliae]|nr:hypothetical protein MANI_025981 [Metarhizium anisopliae]
MTSLDSAIGGMDPDETVAFSDSETAQPAGNETASQTQNTMGKAQLDRVFQFAVEGCEKSYSRAGHLYRHQLNRSLVSQARNQANQHSAGLLPSAPLTGVNRVFGFQHASSLPNQTCNLPDGQDASHIPVQGNRPASRAVASCESGHGDELQSSMPEAIQVFASQSQDLRAVFPIPTELRGSPTAHQGFPISVNGYSDIPRAPVNPGFDSLPSSSYPTFGGETYSKPPFAMEDEFTAWLFNESSVPSSSVAYPSWRGVVPSYLDAAQLQTRTHELSLGGGISHRSMSVARTSDPGSPRTVMSDDKLQELLHLMATRFNKAACSTETTRKESFLEGDVNNDNHILSLRMTRTYIESYWYHFHPQLPILHRSAFVADHAPNLLLAITAIGVSTLDRIHGPEVIETVLRVGQFHRLASPMGGLLLIEVHEKMYSTRFFHERAHIHHGTTLALMRRGGLFIGRSADCSADDRLGSNTTPDSVLGESWTHWIRAEATRRAVFVALVLDSTHAAIGLGPRSRLLRLEFLSECLLHGASEDEGAYSGRDDYNLNRPRVMYMAALVVWCYGIAVDAPILLPPALATAAEQRRDMLELLRRVGGVRSLMICRGCEGAIGVWGC